MSGEEKETILFVDDEENILRSLRRLFHREGYHILLAKSGRKGLELLQEHPVDLVVSDVRMPEMNGVEFLNRVRKTHPEVACMVLSGYAERKAVSRIFSEINIQEMVAKPWDDSELKQTIRDLLNRKETQKDFSPGLYELINSFEALPPLPATYQTVQRALSEAEERSAEVVSEAIGQNPPLAARILQVANSTFFGQRREVETVSRAVFVLGLDFIQNLVLASGTFQQFAVQDAPLFNSDALWRHSLSCGFVARHIVRAQQGDRATQEMALFAGTMHDMGKLILARFAADRYGTVVKKVRDDARSACEIERAILGTDHAEVGGYACELWNLPQRICDAVRFHHQIPPTGSDTYLPSLIYVANTVVHLMDDGAKSAHPLSPDAQRACDVLDLSSKDIDLLFDEIKSIGP